MENKSGKTEGYAASHGFPLPFFIPANTLYLQREASNGWQ